jgi:hypothetical protein
MGIFEGSFPLNQDDIVPAKLVGDDLDLAFRDMFDARQQLSDCGPAFEVISEVLLKMVGCTHKGQHRFAEGLAGDRACFDADPAKNPSAFDDADALSQLCRLDCGSLAGWPAPDAQQIELVGLRHRFASQWLLMTVERREIRLIFTPGPWIGVCHESLPS